MKSKHNNYYIVAFFIGLCAIQPNTYAETTVNPDGFSGDSSNTVGSNSRSAAFGEGNFLSSGSLGNTQGGNLVNGAYNNLNMSDASTMSGLYNYMFYQEGSFIAGTDNYIYSTSSLIGAANVLMGYGNTSSGEGSYGNVLLGNMNTSGVSDAWILGSGNIGQENTVTLGTFAATASNASLIVGRGTDVNNRSNGLVVYKDGRISIPGNMVLGSSSGIYFGSSPSPAITGNANGGANFSSSATFANGLQLSNGSLTVNSATPSTSSATGALIVAGGMGVGGDSWINGVRVGKGSGNVATNTVIGNLALNSNTAGHNNTAVGVSAMKLGSGSYNTALGAEALSSPFTGMHHTAVGYKALSSLSGSISSNTAIGAHSMMSTTTGGFNVAVGSESLISNTTGAQNTGLGRYALFNNTSGSGNVALGLVAGSYHANGSTSLTDPENSIYIGAYSRGKDNNDNNSIVIGTNAIGLGANTTVIGNTSTTTTRIFGNLLIGSGSGSAVLTSASAQSAGFLTNSSIYNYGFISSYDYATSMTGGYAYNYNSTAMSQGQAYGSYSTAMSQGQAYGDYSTAMTLGYANGYFSTAMSEGQAYGSWSTAMSQGQAYGDYSTAMTLGYAYGYFSTAMSQGQAYGSSSTAMSQGQAYGDLSTAMSGGTANGHQSLASGTTTSDSLYSASLGSYNTSWGDPYNWIETDPILMIGNGSDGSQQSNALTTLKNGQTTLTNKAWLQRDTSTVSATEDPPNTTDDSEGNALVVEGHTVLKGKVIIEQPQGDISMGIYQ